MMVGNEIQVFSFEKNSVRVVMKGEEPWFVAKDVCNILGYENSRKALADHIDEDEKGVTKCDTPGGTQVMSIINESGLYALIMRSNKPEAKCFRKWVTSEVIPSIRKHGTYMTPDVLERVLGDPDFMIGLLQELKAEQERSRALAAQNTELKDKNSELSSRNTTLKLQRLRDSKKVQFADAVTASKSHILVGALAKILKQNGVLIGQNRLFKWLRENGYLAKRGNNYNLPTQKAMELGLFFVKEVKVDMGDMGVSIKRTPMITGKGQQYFINLFLSDSEDEE